MCQRKATAFPFKPRMFLAHPTYLNLKFRIKQDEVVKTNAGYLGRWSAVPLLYLYTTHQSHLKNRMFYKYIAVYKVFSHQLQFWGCQTTKVACIPNLLRCAIPCTACILTPLYIPFLAKLYANHSCIPPYLQVQLSLLS